MNTKLIFAATASLLLSSTIATVSVAQQAGADKGARSMTIERALEATERMFDRIDTDNDGVLSQAEVNAIPARGKGMEKAKDKAKGKGMNKEKGKKGRPLVKLMLGENGFTAGMDWNAVEAQVTASFNDRDTDGNGTLTRDEIKPVMDAIKAEHKAS